MSLTYLRAKLKDLEERYRVISEVHADALARDDYRKIDEVTYPGVSIWEQIQTVKREIARITKGPNLSGITF